MRLGKFQAFQLKYDLHFELLRSANDTVIISDGSWENIQCINGMLKGFELNSGLCVNLYKSNLFNINSKDDILEVASTF